MKKRGKATMRSIFIVDISNDAEIVSACFFVWTKVFFIKIQA